MRKAIRGTRRRTIIGAAVLLAGLATCAPAGAARLFVDVNQFDSARYAKYYAGGEANHVTLGGARGHAYVVQDPNVPITTAPFDPPRVDTNPAHVLDAVPYILGGSTGPPGPVWAGYNCVSPRGRGQGICLATPGTVCTMGGCATHSDVRFRGAVLGLGGGDDTATLLQGSSTLEANGSIVVIFADAGNDTLDTRNRGHDIVRCGDGTDTVAADREDDVFPDCEIVTRGRIG